MKILAINASRRGASGYTGFLVDKVLDGVRDAGGGDLQGLHSGGRRAGILRTDFSQDAEGCAKGCAGNPPYRPHNAQLSTNGADYGKCS